MIERVIDPEDTRSRNAWRARRGDRFREARPQVSQAKAGGEHPDYVSVANGARIPRMPRVVAAHGGGSTLGVCKKLHERTVRRCGLWRIFGDDRPHGSWLLPHCLSRFKTLICFGEMLIPCHPSLDLVKFKERAGITDRSVVQLRKRFTYESH